MNSRTFLGPLGLSLLAIFALVMVVIAQVPPLLTAMLTPTVEAVEIGSDIETLVKEHEKDRALYTKRFEGRSPFYVPPPPQPERQQDGPPPVPIEQVPSDRKQPYAGPLMPVGVTDRVWFIAGSTISQMRVGETKQGVRLVSIDGPFDITVAWTAPPTARERFQEHLYQLKVIEWPADLIRSIPPDPGMASQIETPPIDETTPRIDPNDPREMMRQRAQELERRRRDRGDDDDDEVIDEEDAVEEDDEAMEDVEEDDEDDGDEDGDGVENDVEDADDPDDEGDADTAADAAHDQTGGAGESGGDDDDER